MAGVSNIQTDIAARTCRFYLADQNEPLDLKAVLDEFAKTNSHIADWSLADGS